MDDYFSKMQYSVFPILGKIKEKENRFIILSTGFFINHKGLFATAGHTFRKNINHCEAFYICFPKEEEKAELIPVTSYKWLSKRVYGENERKDKILREKRAFQCGPEYMDVGIGKVDLFDTLCFSFQRKRPFEWEKLTSLCYNRNENKCSDKEILILNNLIDSSKIQFSRKSLILTNRLQLARVYYMGHNILYDNIDLFNNCIEVEGSMTFGNSGAPVLNDRNKVIGIVLGGGKFSPTIVHLSRYVNKKIRKLKKKYKSVHDLQALC